MYAKNTNLQTLDIHNIQCLTLFSFSSLRRTVTATPLREAQTSGGLLATVGGTVAHRMIFRSGSIVKECYIYVYMFSFAYIYSVRGGKNK